MKVKMRNENGKLTNYKEFDEVYAKGLEIREAKELEKQAREEAKLQAKAEKEDKKATKKTKKK